MSLDDIQIHVEKMAAFPTYVKSVKSFYHLS